MLTTQSLLFKKNIVIREVDYMSTEQVTEVLCRGFKLITTDDEDFIVGTDEDFILLGISCADFNFIREVKSSKLRNRVILNAAHTSLVLVDDLLKKENDVYQEAKIFFVSRFADYRKLIHIVLKEDHFILNCNHLDEDLLKNCTFVIQCNTSYGFYVPSHLVKYGEIMSCAEKEVFLHINKILSQSGKKIYVI